MLCSQNWLTFCFILWFLWSENLLVLTLIFSFQASKQANKAMFAKLFLCNFFSCKSKLISAFPWSQVCRRSFYMISSRSMSFLPLLYARSMFFRFLSNENAKDKRADQRWDSFWLIFIQSRWIRSSYTWFCSYNCKKNFWNFYNYLRFGFTVK